MPITIQAADLSRDREEVIKFLHQNLTPASDDSRFDWLYLKNPSGRARLWTAVNEAGRLIGTAAAFPRSFSIAGVPQLAWVLGDFCIHPDYRSLGPALQLQRTSMECLTAADHTVCYDFPSRIMMSIYKRLRVPNLGNHVRYVKLLRTDEKIEKYVAHRFLAGCLSRTLNWMLQFQPLSRPVSNGIEFSLQSGEFGPEFDCLEAGENLHSIKGLRSAEYLNWRYKTHPFKTYCVVVARRDTRLAGYVVIEMDSRHAIVADLHTTDAPNTLPAMLGWVESFLRKKGICSVNIPLLEGCRLIPYLRRAGFVPRESSPVIAYTANKAEWLTNVHDRNNWLLFHGDRES